jgi:lipoic acid synthetase
LIAERPDVFNHNIETVARLQRAVRPSAGYARSLSVLARGRAAGLTTKSGMIVGMGETRQEVEETLIDLASVGVQIVTIGHYLRPTTNHLPVARFVESWYATCAVKPAHSLQLSRQTRTWAIATRTPCIVMSSLAIK